MTTQVIITKEHNMSENQEERVYREQINPLLEQLHAIALQHGLSYLVVFQVDDWIRIDHILTENCCSELKCAAYEVGYQYE